MLAASAQETGPAALPVKKVALFKNGVGFFEHEGRIRGDQAISVGFTSGQLNDVLKSLTVLDLGGGKVTSVRYDSQTPAERRLDELQLPVGEKPTLTEFLGALRGARIEVRSGTTVLAGRLLSIERKTRISGGTTLEVDYVSMITDAGELRTSELTPAFSVRLLDVGLSSTVGRYLDVIASKRGEDRRRLVIQTAGTGERPLFVSYVSEVPVWKATYRVVLSNDRKPLLQGWAIVDNTVGEDWVGVSLALVSGAPQSFIQKLSQPYYSRRPVVSLPEAVSGVPQTLEPTLRSGGGTLRGRISDASDAGIAGARVRAIGEDGSLLNETSAEADGRYVLSGLAEGRVQVQVESPGFQAVTISGVNVSINRPTDVDARLQVGSVSHQINVVASAPTANTLATDVARSKATGTGRTLGTRGQGSGGGVGSGMGSGRGGGSFAIGEARSASASESDGQQLGDLFEYRIKDPVTIRKNQSALIPIVHSDVQVEKVSVWNESAGRQRPLRALWLSNTSGLTLDGGPFSVLEQETFAGEGIFESIRAGEKRLIGYASDLALTAGARTATEAQRVSRVRISRGVMIHEQEVRETKTYTFRNEDQSPRSVLVEHPARVGYTLRSEVKPEEITPQWQRFRVTIAPKQTATLVVSEARPLEATYVLSNINSDLVATLVKDRSVNSEIEGALRRILAQKATVDELEDKKQRCDNSIEQIYEDQQRLRENLKALKGSAEEKALTQRYTQQLNEQESTLAALKNENIALDQQIAAAKAVESQMINALVMDVRL